MVDILHIDKNTIPTLNKSVACIGYFDGMHKGHQKLIFDAVNKARERGLLASLICFSPDPAEVIFHKKNPHLFPDEERYKIAVSFGIDQIIVIRFDEEFKDLEPESFIHDYLEKMNIEELICGFDFSFGKYGKGTPELLKKTASFKVSEIKEEKYYGNKISSTRIKKCIEEGNFRLAGKLLGFPYYFILKQANDPHSKDNKLLPYILKDENCLMPKDGKYLNLFEVKEGRFYLPFNKELKKKKTIKVICDQHE